jgi:hypothetical protein
VHNVDWRNVAIGFLLGVVVLVLFACLFLR